MSLARLCIFLGIVACIVGGIFFILPGNFVYSQMITFYVTAYGSLLLPGLGTNKNLEFFIRKSPTIILVLTGLVFIIVGLYHEIKVK